MPDPHTDIYAAAPFLWPLARLSARLGKNMTDVQGLGGNTSVKQNGVLWVKGSGLGLANVNRRPGFVPVDLEAARAAAGQGGDMPIAALDHPLAEGLRPSIETSLHALMPHPCVAHTHQVDVIAWAVRADAAAALTGPLDGLDWTFVDYARPGLPLTRAVHRALGQNHADILILGNHGLVVGGKDPPEVERRLEDVRRRLALEPRGRSLRPDFGRLARLTEGTQFTACRHKQGHLTAFDETAMRVAGSGVLYPDHLVFLGTETVIVPPDAETLPAAAEARLLVCAGRGAVIHRDCPPAAHAMAACLGLVTSRIDPAAQLRYLSEEDITALMGWDAEKHRQHMAAKQ